jgi:hypothetical protein
MNLFNDGNRLDGTLKRFEEINREGTRKRETYSRLLTSIEHVEKTEQRHYYFRRIATVIATVFAAFFILLGGYSYIQDGRIPFIDHQQATYPSIQIEPTGFTIKENEDGTWTFLSADFEENQVVGGLSLMTSDEMQLAISEGAIFEKEEIDGFPWPTTRTLVHVKTMEAVQTIHYYFQPEGESETVYDLYFHTPFFDKDEAFQIAQSFRVND